jgi:hypothetical protein
MPHPSLVEIEIGGVFLCLMAVGKSHKNIYQKNAHPLDQKGDNNTLLGALSPCCINYKSSRTGR